MLDMRKICRSFPGVQALLDVDFVCQAGEIHALVGENGAGNSTLMNCLGGMLKPDEGEIVVNDEVRCFQGVDEAQACGIAFVHQETSLLDNLSVAENIFVGREPKTTFGMTDQAAMLAETRRFFERLQLSIDPAAHVATLKMSEKQMVEIARAVYASPCILILDEPTAALDEALTKTLFSLLGELKAAGTAIIYISHRLDEILQLADRVTVLKDGRNAGELSGEAMTKENMIRLMVGREITDIYPDRSNAGQAGEVVLDVVGLVVPGAVSPVSFQVRAGEILGIGGLEGQGQRELLRTLAGDLKAVSGEISLNGTSISRMSIKGRIKRGLYYITDDRRGRGLILPMSIAKNITLSSLERIENACHLLDAGREKKVAAAYSEALGIRSTGIGQIAANLSGGNQQKVMIGRSLSASPKLLIFDEPTKGIDVGARMSIYEIMADLTRQGVAVIMLTSDLMELIGISDRILVFYDRNVSGEIKREDATEERIMQASYGLAADGQGGGSC